MKKLLSRFLVIPTLGLIILLSIVLYTGCENNTEQLQFQQTSQTNQVTESEEDFKYLESGFANLLEENSGAFHYKYRVYIKKTSDKSYNMKIYSHSLQDYRMASCVAVIINDYRDMLPQNLNKLYLGQPHAAEGWSISFDKLKICCQSPNFNESMLYVEKHINKVNIP